MKSEKIILFFIIIALITSCQPVSNVESSIRGFTQGASYSVKWYHKEKIQAQEVQDDIENLLAVVDSSLSTYNPASIISRVNRNEDVILDSFFIDVFNRSYEIWDLTGGAFDITAAPLINAWGFGPDATKRFNESIKNRLMELVGMDKIKIVEDRVVKNDPAMCLDVNAIAQGYTVDVLCDYMSSRGFERYLVEVGGEVRTRGTKPGDMPWIIGLDKPSDGNYTPGLYRQADIKLVDKAL
ncbi:MAG: FAD:protein FMN transferase, partial [Bacteroidales bacterium]|nr:FAD:protein FMN transferase [Bacteroidales bacterium]